MAKEILTVRQARFLKLCERDDKEIADALRISVSGVRKLSAVVMRKLHAGRRRQLIFNFGFALGQLAADTFDTYQEKPRGRRL
jgi:DNA-binding CsgD family transcriptional regulator